MARKTVEVLREARALIDTPEKWTKNADARDAHGEELEYAEVAKAACWCAGGAIAAVLGDEGGACTPAFAVLARVMGVEFPFQFNDREETTHADVLAAFDAAIAACEAGQ